MDALGVEIAGANVNSAPHSEMSRRRAAVAHHPRLAVGVGRADDQGIVDLHAHPFQALVKVDPVVVWVIGAARLDVACGVVVDHFRRRHPPAYPEDDGRRQLLPAWTSGNRRTDDLGDRRV